MSEERTSAWAAALLCLLLIAFGAALASSLVDLWPVVTHISSVAGKAGSDFETTQHKVYFAFSLFSLRLTPSASLLVLVLIMGAVGSYVHIATSFSDFVGNRRFRTSWFVWYLLRSFIGAALAVLLYVVFRAGLFNASAASNQINPYGVAAVAGLAGLFSKQATDKLREVFETLFRVGQGKGDAQRGDDLAAPVPTLSGLHPSGIAAGSGDTTVTVAGTGFDPHAVARVAGVDLPATVNSASELTVVVKAAALGVAGQLTVVVVNPPPGGGASNSLLLDVV